MTGRKATTAHPLCTCREHDHARDRCLGADMVFESREGKRTFGTCRILGGITAESHAACVMHGAHR